MSRLVKKIIIAVIICCCVVGGIGYALTPKHPIDNSKRLCNVDERIDLKSINKDVITDIDQSNEGTTVSMRVNNYLFNKILKYNLLKVGEQGLEAYQFELEGDYLNVKAPVKYGVVKSVADLKVSVRANDKSLILKIDKVKLGKIDIPSFIKEQLTQSLGKQSSKRIHVKGNCIYVDFGSTGVTVKKADIKDGNLEIRFALSKGTIKKAGISVIEEMFDY